MKRLQRDLCELRDTPVANATAEPIEDNLYKWRAVVVGPEGTPYHLVPIIIDLEFSDDYPQSPPKAFFLNNIEYVGGASYKEGGRTVVCLNIFGNFGHVHTEWKDESAGWSPTMSVQTVLVAVQALMMEGLLSDSAVAVRRTRESAEAIRAAHWVPDVVGAKEAREAADKSRRERLEKTAADPLRALKEHFVCGITRKNFTECSIGYGLGVKNERTAELASPCEYMDHSVLTSAADGVARSSTNMAIRFWLPIILKNAKFDGAVFRDQLMGIAGHVVKLSPGLSQNEAILKIFTSTMNGLVLQIMDQKASGKINDRFIDGYFSFFRLMRFAAARIPAIAKLCTSSVQNFIAQPAARSKKATPNLGELLVCTLLCEPGTWDLLAAPFMLECDARNYLWYAARADSPLKRFHNSTKRDGRASQIFAATAVSRNIVAFQVRFAQVAREISDETFEANFGLAPEELRADLRDIYTKVTGLADWDAYFTWLRIPTVPVEERTTQLIEAMNESRRAGYHR